MEQTPSAEPHDAADPAGDERPVSSSAASPVEIAIARTGGFAGLTRRWTARPREEEATWWISLIDRCPWDDLTGDTAARTAPVADGFVWSIRARWPDDHAREAELPEDAITGAWRDLVEAVRAWKPPGGAETDARRPRGAGRRPG
jgi:hypothetical protein